LAPEGDIRPINVSKRLVGGEETKRSLELLLGLVGVPEAWKVSLAVWYDNYALVVLGPRHSPLVVFRIEPVSHDSPAWIRFEYLKISYSGARCLPEILQSKVLQGASANLASMRPEDVLRIFESDPRTSRLPSDKNKEATNLLTSWAGSDAYAEFFATAEIAKSRFFSISLQRGFRYIQHCDLECMMQWPHSIAPLIRLVDFPWDDRLRAIDCPEYECYEAMNTDDSMFITELTESDAVLGNPQRLREVLEYAISRPNPEGKMIFVNNTCLPMVVGEDVKSVVRQYARRSSVPIVYLTVTGESMSSVFRDLLFSRRKAVEDRTPQGEGKLVNLIGFKEGITSRCIVGLLEDMGLKVNTHLIPDLSTSRIDRIPLACANIFYPNALWSDHYAYLIKDTRLKSVTPYPPYGFEGCKRFLEEVGRELGLERQATETFDRVSARYRDEWEGLRHLASAKTVGIVVRAEETALIVDPAATFGIPVCPFLEEAGFRVEILLRAEGKYEAKKAYKTISSVFRKKDSFVIRVFNTFEGLRRLLMESCAEAFFSNHYFDWRLSEAGKARFSLQIFEMGFDGAIRTVRSLLRICDTPFYRRYKDYLTRREDGVLALGEEDGG